jgi:hypothetical protein
VNRDLWGDDDIFVAIDIYPIDNPKKRILFASPRPLRCPYTRPTRSAPLERKRARERERGDREREGENSYGRVRVCEAERERERERERESVSEREESV